MCQEKRLEESVPLLPLSLQHERISGQEVEIKETLPASLDIYHPKRNQKGKKKKRKNRIPLNHHQMKKKKKKKPTEINILTELAGRMDEEKGGIEEYRWNNKRQRMKTGEMEVTAQIHSSRIVVVVV